MGLIRFLLAAAVVAEHAGPILGSRLVGGGTAVQTFYIISGFYMALILNGKYARGYFLFISNRFLRIFPVYWVCLVLATLLLFFFGALADGVSLEGATYGSGWLSEAASPSLSAAGLILLVNVALFFRTLFAFLAIDPGTGGLFFFGDDPAPQLVAHLFFPVSQAWTLDIELVFYLLAPFLVRRGLPALLALMVAFFALRLGIRFAYQELFPTTWELKLYFTPFAQIGFFMAGAVSYWFYRRWKEHLPKGPGLVLLCVVAALTIGFFFVPLPPSWTSKLYYLLVFLSLPLIFESTRHSRLDRWIGETSYPIYVGHYIVVLAIDGLGYSLAASGPAALIGATALAALLIVAVSAPVERYRQRRVSGSAPSPPTGNR